MDTNSKAAGLAVLDRWAAELEHADGFANREAFAARCETRDAFAELVEAARKVTSERAGIRATNPQGGDALADLMEALARVGGGK